MVYDVTLFDSIADKRFELIVKCSSIDLVHDIVNKAGYLPDTSKLVRIRESVYIHDVLKG